MLILNEIGLNNWRYSNHTCYIWYWLFHFRNIEFTFLFECTKKELLHHNVFAILQKPIFYFFNFKGITFPHNMPYPYLFSFFFDS